MITVVWVDAKTLGGHLGWSETKVRGLARSGQIPGKPWRNGCRTYWRFNISAVDAAITASINQP